MIEDEKSSDSPAKQSMDDYEMADDFVVMAGGAHTGFFDKNDLKKPNAVDEKEDLKQFEQEKKIAISKLQNCTKEWQKSPEIVVGMLIVVFDRCYDCLKTLGIWISVRPKATVEAMKDLGININDIKNREGKTPLLEFLSEKRNLRDNVFQYVFCTLVDAGCDVTAIDRSKRTALHYAAHNGYTWACLELLKKVTVDPVDSKNNTPLHLAALRGQIEVCQILVASGANIQAQNKDGLTPLSYNPDIALFVK